MSRRHPESAAVYVAPCDLGHGLFAGRDFRQGEFIFRFTGQVISLADSIAKDEAESNPLQIEATAYIDLEPPSVFANHSCNPNIGIRHGKDASALRDIILGEEVRFDYSTTMSERRWTMRCQCGTHTCREVIGDFHDLPLDLQRHYLKLQIVQPFIVEEWRSFRHLELNLDECLYPAT